MVDKDQNDSIISLEQLVQNVNNIAQILSRLTTDMENGAGLLFQPYNSLLTSIAALSVSLTTGGLITGSGLGTVAATPAGTSGQFLKTIGTGGAPVWADAFVKIAVQKFIADGTYTPTTGMMFAIGEVVGGGGGSGGCTSTAGNAGGGAGGGAGSYAKTLLTAASVGASKGITIGTVGAAGTAGNNAGGNGGDTSIGVLCIGKGGTGGNGNPGVGNAATGGAGGVAGTGDLTIVGAAGGYGNGATILTVGISGGEGAGSFWVGPTPPIFARGANGAAVAAPANSGCGGAGGVSFNAGGTQAGGAGGTGLVMITEFCKV